MQTLLDKSNAVYSGTVPVERRGEPQTFYHGTSPENAAKILMNGFDLDAKRSHDPGDFGSGIYLTTSRTRAKHMGGPAILEVSVNLRQFAYIPNPYFTRMLEQVAPIGPVQEMFYCLAFDAAGEMATIHGDKLHKPDRIITLRTREQVCVDIRERFLKEGFHGIHTEYQGRETVVFNLRAITRISWDFIDRK